ncbi:hypothetical protein P7K49_024798 [Saguinus oedipus]|uniref:Uncharacterized protein n=1 Tax=Saguinus oedipus TaxID=9490 RepID=A0ABQ9UQJ0_SAGOE|nr:hypothetical protein P7K49_024798 [Saguinus oedipus]
MLERWGLSFCSPAAAVGYTTALGGQSHAGYAHRVRQSLRLPGSSRDLTCRSAGAISDPECAQRPPHLAPVGTPGRTSTAHIRNGPHGEYSFEVCKDSFQRMSHRSSQPEPGPQNPGPASPSGHCPFPRQFQHAGLSRHLPLCIHPVSGQPGHGARPSSSPPLFPGPSSGAAEISPGERPGPRPPPPPLALPGPTQKHSRTFAQSWTI